MPNNSGGSRLSSAACTWGATHRAVVQPADGAGISRGGLRYASPSCESCLIRLEICMDCDNIVRWSNGTWKLYNDRYEEPLLQVMDKVARLRDFGCRPRGVGSDWLAHIPRGENRRADHLAAHPSDDCRLLHPLPWPRHVRARTDGGSSRVHAGCGWELWGCCDASEEHDGQGWVRLAESSWLLPIYVLPIEAEFCGLLSFLSFLCRLVQEGAMGDGSGRCEAVREEWIASGARPRLWELAWVDEKGTAIRVGSTKRAASTRQGDYQEGAAAGHDEARRQRSRGAEAAETAASR